MITDKIKFKPGFAKEDSKTYSSAGVEVRGVAPDRLWRNLCNISIWNRLNPMIVDIQPLDSADTDPHLYDKMQFNYTLDCGKRVVAQVIFFQPPKDDRPGRLAYQGTVMDGDRELDEIVAEFMIGVPDHGGVLTADAAMSSRNEIPDAPVKDYGACLETMLRNLTEWSEKHD